MHNYVETDGPGCGFVLQDGVPCGMDRGNKAHSPESAEAISLESITSGGFRPVMDAPADDEGIARAARGSATVDAEGAARALGWDDAEQRELWLQMARRLENRADIVWGPWPVRQFRLEGASSFGGVTGLASQLLAVGEPFAVETQWSGSAHVVLFTWGDYYASARSDICGAVRRTA